MRIFQAGHTGTTKRSLDTEGDDEDVGLSTDISGLSRRWGEPGMMVIEISYLGGNYSERIAAL